MKKYEYLEKINPFTKEYDGFTLEELIENIGYYHMTKGLKNHEKYGKYDENYHKIVKLYTEYPRIRKKIVETLTDLEGTNFHENDVLKFLKNEGECTE